MLEPKYLTMCGEGPNLQRSLCSFCKGRERESSVCLTAKRSPETELVASDTVAEEPCPMTGPRVHFIVVCGMGGKRGRDGRIGMTCK